MTPSKPSQNMKAGMDQAGSQTSRAVPSTANEIRASFFEFFQEKEHLIVPSSPVVPADDPTLLFMNAGMNPFKPIFLGEEEGFAEGGKLWKRVADTQKCIRVSGKHNDLEEVGIDTYHHTLFEMLGNWSFGDYFKKEAIQWAWELLVERWGLDPGRLYATVFGGDASDGLEPDTEAEQLWASETSIPKDHILRFGKKDNFWEMGETGPCGPCSELHIDLRSDQERAITPGASLVNADDPRVMEIWNLVFIQFERLKDGSLKSLPAKHVDTGMGFERICAVLQGKTSNYDSDVFQGLIAAIAKRAGVSYGDQEKTDIAMRVIADHVRAVSFAIADGASPSNEGRGYVIRRILRRAIRYGWDSLGIREPFVFELVPVLAAQFKEIFPELEAQKSFVADIIRAEENSFIKTLGQGIELFTNMSDGVKEISGENAFKLHDTYGFPIDLTQLMARERGLTVDTAGFEALMKEQKERARAAGKFGVDQGAVEWSRVGAGSTVAAGSGSGAAGESGATTSFEFVGYDRLDADVQIVATAQLEKGGLILLDKSPFYAESGGQTADTGTLRKGNVELRVVDVQKGAEGFIHTVNRLPEDPSGVWTAQVDLDRRIETRRHHTAAHLLHAALRQVLGTHVVQKGSLVTLDKVRFDFAHHQAVTPGELAEVERIVNERIRQNIDLLEERDVPIEEARNRGAMMLFGEKYGDKVRMITFDKEFSMELCAGTHAEATGELGFFRLISETSVAAGIRRVEGVTSKKAETILQDELHTLHEVQRELGNPKDVIGALQKVILEKQQLEKELSEVQSRQLLSQLDALLQNGQKINLSGGDFSLYAGKLDGADMEGLKKAGYEALNRAGNESAIVLVSPESTTGKVYVLAALSQDLVDQGYHAGKWVKELAQIVGGGGGGQPTLATAGGRDASRIDELLERSAELLQNSSS